MILGYDIRNEYRLYEFRYPDRSGYFEIQIKRWWFPWWRPIRYKFGLIEAIRINRNGGTIVENNFAYATEAERYAKRHAKEGRYGMIKWDHTITYHDLGKLP